MQRVADRRLQEADAARVSRRVPRVRRAIGVMRQRLEERRQQLVEVVGSGTHDLPRQELRRVLVQVQEGGDVAQRIGGRRQVGAQGRGFAERDDRQPGCTFVHRAQPGHHLRQRLRIAVRTLGAEHDRRQPAMRSGHDAGVLARVHDDRLPAATLELMLDLPQAHAGHRLRRDVAMRDEDGKARLELHGSLPLDAGVWLVAARCLLGPRSIRT
jgi:hypothetical protein